MEPETTLWIAVLNQAIRDTQALVKKIEINPGIWKTPIFRSDVQQLKRYFQSQSMEPGSFGFICDLMEVNTEQASRQMDDLYFQYLIPTMKHHTNTAVLPAI